MKTRQIREFNKAFDYPTPKEPTVEANFKLRHTLIAEELREYYDACLDKDIIEIADAIGDMLYLVLGAAVEHGININPVFDEIHRSNMSKLQDGKVIRREDGKVLKGENYFPPNIEKVLKLNPIKEFEAEDFMEHCVDVVCEKYKINKEELFNKTRKREYVEARQVVFYLVDRRFKKWGHYEKAIRKWTNLDRVTVSVHSVRTIAGIIDYDLAFSDKVDVMYFEVLSRL